jgi:cell division protein FtsB
MFQLLVLKLSFWIFNNSIEREAAIAKAEQLAAQAVGATSAQSNSDEEKISDLDDPDALRQDILDKYPNSAETLAKAGEILNSEERIASLNANLDSGDEAVVRSTFAFTRELVERPDQFADAGSAPDGGFNEDTYNRCVEEVGAEHADMIRTLGLAVISGKVSTAEALRTASGDPKLLTNMMLLSRKGIIKIAIS